MCPLIINAISTPALALFAQTSIWPNSDNLNLRITHVLYMVLIIYSNFKDVHFTRKDSQKHVSGRHNLFKGIWNLFCSAVEKRFGTEIKTYYLRMKTVNKIRNFPYYNLDKSYKVFSPIQILKGMELIWTSCLSVITALQAISVSM